MSTSPSDAATARATLLGRCALTSAWALEPLGNLPSPDAWPSPPRAVAEIRGVVAEIAATLAELRANAEAARLSAGELRDAALAAGANSSLVLAAYDTLVATIDQTEATKVVAFETELVAGDAVLEETEAELSAIGELATRASDEDLIGVFDRLSARLDALFERLRGFPSGPVEEPTLSVVPAAGPLGTVLSQLIHPDGIVVALPSVRRVLPGTQVRVELTLPKSSVVGDAGHYRLALLRRTAARASLLLPGGKCVPVAALIAPLLSSYICGIAVTFEVPADTALGSSFIIDTVTVAQKAPGGAAVCLFPCALAVVDFIGIIAPFTLTSIARDYQTPCVSQDGRIFVAKGRQAESESVGVFDKHGVLLESLTIHRLASPRTVAYVEGSGVLLIRDGAYGSTDIVAVDLRSPARPPDVLWTHTMPEFPDSSKLGPGGLVALPELGIAVYAANFANSEVVAAQFFVGGATIYRCLRCIAAVVVAIRLSDGSVVQTLAHIRPLYVAAGPPGTATVYVSSQDADRVCGVRFDASDPALPAVVLPPLIHVDPPTGHGNPALAVMPPAPGESTWFLVVGDYCTRHVSLLALPGGEKVFEATGTITGDLPGDGTSGPGSWGTIRGLAADPAGAALIVVGDDDVWAVPWPLPGMQPVAPPLLGRTL